MVRRVRAAAIVIAVGLVAGACTTNDSLIGVFGGEAVAPIDIDPVPTDPAPSEPAPSEPEPSEPEPTVMPTPTPIPRTLEEIIDAAIDDVEIFWETALPDAYGISFEPVVSIDPYFPSDESTIPSCGGESAPLELLIGNAFYCFVDDFIAYDNEELFPELFSDFGGFTVALVLAHEYGHAVQARASEQGPTVNIELQADCFAGAWARSLESGDSEIGITISDGDLEGAIGGFLLFRDPVQANSFDPGAHGTAFDRVSAFAEGFRAGTQPCTTLDTDPPVLENIPFSTVDLQTGGNLPLDELLEPLVEPALNTFWTTAFATIDRGEFAPPTRAPYFPSTGVLPECSSLQAPVSALENSAFYCTANNTVAWDEEVLLPDLFSEAGDFAASYPVIHAWSQAAMTQLGADTSGRAGIEAADCLTGSFSGAIFAGEITEPDIRLSAGDLDEGVIGILSYGPATPDLAEIDTQADNPFDRVAAFSDGFRGGLGACLPTIFN